MTADDRWRAWLNAHVADLSDFDRALVGGFLAAAKAVADYERNLAVLEAANRRMEEGVARVRAVAEKLKGDTVD